MLASEIINFLFNLHLPFTPPAGVEVLDAYKQPEIREACREFYERYYSDNSPRHLLLGINPGRFGGGVTGIPFTDPIRLQNACGIHNNFQKKQELSSVFMYNMIDALGGPQAFYSRFIFRPPARLVL